MRNRRIKPFLTGIIWHKFKWQIQNASIFANKFRLASERVEAARIQWLYDDLQEDASQTLNEYLFMLM